MREQLGRLLEWYLKRHIFWQLVILAGLDGITISVTGPFGIVTAVFSLPAAGWLIWRWWSDES